MTNGLLIESHPRLSTLVIDAGDGNRLGRAPAAELPGQVASNVSDCRAHRIAAFSSLSLDTATVTVTRRLRHSVSYV